MTYSEPVNQLLKYDKCKRYQPKYWPDYLSLGLTEKDIPQLIEMFKDKDLQFAKTSSMEVWAPVHAWRTLGQLKAKEEIDSQIIIAPKEYPGPLGIDWIMKKMGWIS